MQSVILVCLDGPLAGQRFACRGEPPSTFGVAKSVQREQIVFVPVLSGYPPALAVEGAYVPAEDDGGSLHERFFRFVDAE